MALALAGTTKPFLSDDISQAIHKVMTKINTIATPHNNDIVGRGHDILARLQAAQRTIMACERYLQDSSNALMRGVRLAANFTYEDLDFTIRAVNMKSVNDAQSAIIAEHARNASTTEGWKLIEELQAAQLLVLQYQHYIGYEPNSTLGTQRAIIPNHDFELIPFPSNPDQPASVRRFEVFLSKLISIKAGKVVVLCHNPHEASWMNRDLISIMHRIAQKIRVYPSISSKDHVVRNIELNWWMQLDDGLLAVLLTDSIGTATLDFEKAPYLFNFDVPNVAKGAQLYEYFGRLDKLLREGKIKQATTFIDPSINAEYDMAVDLAKRYVVNAEFRRASEETGRTKGNRR